MESYTDKRNRITQEHVNKIDELLWNSGYMTYRTGDNLNTVTIEIEDGEETYYASLKFTLHKENYNLEEQIENYNMVLEEKKIKDKLKKERREKEAKEKEAKLKKQEERKNQLAAAREKRKGLLNKG